MGGIAGKLGMFVIAVAGSTAPAHAASERYLPHLPDCGGEAVVTHMEGPRQFRACASASSCKRFTLYRYEMRCTDGRRFTAPEVTMMGARKGVLSDRFQFNGNQLEVAVPGREVSSTHDCTRNAFTGARECLPWKRYRDVTRWVGLPAGWELLPSGIRTREVAPQTTAATAPAASPPEPPGPVVTFLDAGFPFSQLFLFALFWAGKFFVRKGAEPAGQPIIDREALVFQQWAIIGAIAIATLAAAAGGEGLAIFALWIYGLTLAVFLLTNVSRIRAGLYYVFTEHPAEAVVEPALNEDKSLDMSSLTRELALDHEEIDNPRPVYQYRSEAKRAEALKEKLDKDAELARAAVNRERMRAARDDEQKE
jgi:hypothetical protein